MLTHKSFDHLGGWYHYRIHNLKAEELCNHNFQSVKSFLYGVIKNCPDEFFNTGPRSSTLTFDLNVELTKIKNHEVSKLAETGLKDRRFQTAHSKVQAFMLENDNNTIAAEVPLWIKNHELESYKELFNTIKPLTGHADILRMENNKVWIWDYKPRAHLEEKAATQVYFYALMLCKRTNTDLKEIRCGYFDADNAYVFKPEEAAIMKNEDERLFKVNF